MTSPSSTWRVADALASDEWDWAAQALSDIEREVQLEIWGSTDLWAPPNVWRARLSDRVDVDRRLYLAVPDVSGTPHPDEVAGFALLTLPRAGNDHLAILDIGVRSGHRRAGLATTLLRRAEREVACLGRTVIAAWASSAPEPPPGPGAIEAPTGSGRLRADLPSTGFALRHGFTLEQVSRHSVLAVPEELSGIEELRAASLAQADHAYRLHTWHDAIPVEWHAQVALLHERMLADIPTAGLDVTTEPWDAERVRRWIDGWTDRDLHVAICAAEHVSTGTLAGFTVLYYPLPEVPFAFQDDTLVLDEHRGHRLGMAMKTTNLLETVARRPGLRRIHTDNAEENAPMLAINVALGFAAVGVVAAWQRRLP